MHETPYGPHYHPKEAIGDMDFYLYQDEFMFMGEKMYAVPHSAEVHVYSHEDYYSDDEAVTIVQGSGEMIFLFTTDIAEMTNWTPPIASRYYSHSGGKNITMEISIEHHYGYEEPTDGSDKWIRVLTDDIRGRVNFRMENGEMRYVNLGVSDYSWWYGNPKEGEEEEEVIIGMRIEVDFSAAYMPEPATQNPEPTTMALLGIGGLAVLKRRRRRLQML